MKNIKIVSLLFCLALIPLVSNRLPPNTVGSIKLEFVSLIQTPLKLINSFSNMASAFEFKNLHKENTELKKQVGVLKQRLIDFREIDIENIRLKKLLDFKETLQYRTISVQVIGKDASAFSMSLIINKGYNDGVKLDMPVIAPLGLVGKVSEVGKNIARVTLIKDPNLKVSVMTQTTRDEAILESYRKGLCRMKYVDVNASLLKNDIVLTSGKGGVYPKGLPVGTVVSYKKDFNRLYQIATVKPFVDFSKIEELICLQLD